MTDTCKGNFDKRTDNGNVIDIVVASDMCTGCGVCVGVCPVKCLEMRLLRGEYKPVLVGSCVSKCDICFRICPFFDHSTHQDDLARTRFASTEGIHEHSVLGFYLDCYLGYSAIHGHRENGASGGMVTWVLERLITTGEIDRVVTVRNSTREDGALFEYAIMDSVAAVRAAASSKYYPVELSEPLKCILGDDEEHRYAVVGVPCFLYALARAISINKKLKQKIPYLLGLVCGLYPSSYYTEALTVWAGMRCSRIKNAGYRFTDGIKYGQDYRFRAQEHTGKWSRPVGFFETHSHLWAKYYFAKNVCNYCDDVFAEVADAVFMDAWLPNLLTDTKGTSIVAVRNSNINDILLSGLQDKSCILTPCTVEDVVLSQKELVNEKRERIRQRITVAQYCGQWLPKMRTSVSNITPIEFKFVLIRKKTISISKQIWPHFRKMPRMLLALFILIVDTRSGGLFYGIKSFVRVFGKIVHKIIKDYLYIIYSK